MAPRNTPSVRLWLLSMISWIPASLGVSMAAWWPNVGVQVIVQDPYTLDLHYSYCNQGYEVVFPVTEPLKLPITTKPRNGTAITGAGWWDETTTWALVWYFDEFNNLVHGRYRCDPDTGTFEKELDDVLSDELPSSVKLNKNSGVGAALLGATDGIRAYLHSEEGEIHSLIFTNDRGWKYEKIINPDQDRSSYIMGVFSRVGSSNEITLITPKDSKNMEETKLDPDGIWYIDTFPASLAALNVTNASNRTRYAISERDPGSSSELEAWDGNTSNIGIAMGERSRSLFYIGTDRALHQMDSFPTPQKDADPKSDPLDAGVWRKVAGQHDTRWPLADEENADFAFATWLSEKGSHVRIFYMVEGELTQATYENNTWYQAEKVATELKANSRPLSNGAKAGIAVGAFFGAFALVVVSGVCFYLKRRRQDRQEYVAAAASSIPTSPYYMGSPHMGTGSQWYMAYSPHQAHMSCMSTHSFDYVAMSEPKFEPVAINQEPRELPENSLHSPGLGTFSHSTTETHEMVGEG